MGNEVKRQAFTQLLVFGPMQIYSGFVLLSFQVPFTSLETSLRSRSLSGWLVVDQCPVVHPNSNLPTSSPQTNLTATMIWHSMKIWSKHKTIHSPKPFKSQILKILPTFKKDKKLMSLVQEKLCIERTGWSRLACHHQYTRGYIGQSVHGNRLSNRWTTRRRSRNQTTLLWSISETDMSNRGFSLVSNAQGDYQCGRGSTVELQAGVPRSEWRTA